MNVERHALIAMGGNLSLGDNAPEATLRQAIVCLNNHGLAVISCSEFYRTPAFPKGAGPDYVNAAVLVKLSQEKNIHLILTILHEIEANLGRTRQKRWGGRTLDLDLLAVDQEVAPDLQTHAYWRDLAPSDQMLQAPSALILPHPRLQDRAFVLVPLADIAPNWVHPILGLSVAQMLANLPAADRAEVVPF